MLHSDRLQNAPAKDAFYDLLKGATYNWRLFLSRVSSFLIVTCFKPLTGDHRNRVLIYDDSTYRRHRSKHVELLSRVRDHTTGHYVRGFRMPTLGWSDGVTFIPLAFSLLSSQKKKNRYQEMDASVDKRTLGYRRRKEALMKGTEVLFCLLDAINPLELGAQTLLFDSWFAFPGVIKRVVKNYPLQVICMLKRMPRVYYTYEGKRYTLTQLYHQIRKKRGRAKILASAFVGLGVDEDGSEQRAKIVFVRDHHRSKQWLALLTTSLEQTDEEVVRVYGKRWAIECFFKMTKSHLRLAKECQCRNYDALIAHTTIVFLRYIMLAWSAREEQDPRTLGNLFSLCCDEIEDLRFAEALMTLLELLSSTLMHFSLHHPLFPSCFSNC